MVTVVLVGILAAIVIPGFNQFIKNSRLSTSANELHTSLLLARSEALGRISRVTVCKSNDGESCAAVGNWEDGWIVFHDPDNDAEWDAGESLLQVAPPLEKNTLRGEPLIANYVSYVGDGSVKDTAGKTLTGNLVVCDDRGFVARTLAINLSVTGRTRVLPASNIGLAGCL